MGERRMNTRFWWGPEKKRAAGRTRRRWKDNIETDLQKLEGKSVEWITLAQERDRWRALVNGAMNYWVPKNVGNFLTSWEPVRSSKGLRSIEFVSTEI
jgi:hypothetical protein